MSSGTSSPVGGVRLGGTAPVGFTPTDAAQVDADVIVEWDLDGDGDFDDPLEDVTSYLIDVQTRQGRDYPSSVVGQTTAGQMRLTLLNTDGRFSTFNADSPLQQPPFGIKTGRTLRLRTAESTPADPVLLARDRFPRASDPLLPAETGQAWTVHSGAFTSTAGLATIAGATATVHLATIDVGANDYYAQMTCGQLNGVRHCGIVVRYTDANNYVTVHVRTSVDTVVIRDRVAGVITDTEVSVTPWEGMTIGALVEGSTVTAYVGGAPVASMATGTPAAGRVGLYGFDNSFESLARPQFGDFHVWDTVAAPIDGVLFTGDLVSVTPVAIPGAPSTVTVEVEGVLARANRSTVAAPRLAYGGNPTGMVVGDILARAGLLHPPAPLDLGTVDTGTVGVEDNKALDLARQLEAIELGMLRETNEGQITFDDADARASASPVAWFSDTDGIGQYRFSAISPVDHRGRLVNRATAVVAPDAPGPVTYTIDFGSGHVDVGLPSTSAGDLLFVFIANTNDGAHDWNNPIWWVNHRDLKTAHGMRIYSHFCDGSESGSTVRFYQHNGVEAGLWMAHIVRIESWFESYEGIVVGDATRGIDASGITHNWGRDSTLFLAEVVAIGGAGGGLTYDPNKDLPIGYEKQATDAGNIVGSGTAAYDAAVFGCFKIDSTAAEDPTALDTLSNALIVESIVVAVRGYNGPHTKPTLDNPRTTGGTGRQVTVEDVASQDDHQGVFTWESPRLYASEADATDAARRVIDAYADDRPVVSISFPATLNAGHREQAATRRVGDMIYLDADGTTGLGVTGPFFVESIAHAMSAAGKVWTATWELSPA